MTNTNVLAHLLRRFGEMFNMISIKSIMIYSTLILFFTFICLLYILGVARYVTDYEENTCEMTYMFEYPQYVVCKPFCRCYIFYIDTLLTIIFYKRQEYLFIVIYLSFI